MKKDIKLNVRHVSSFMLSSLAVLSVQGRNYVEKASAESPNLIYIIADQLRFDALSCMGNKIISTPNMDRLAAEGVIFTRAYSQSPVSVPSRSSMLTGNSLCNTGIWGNTYAYEFVSGSLLTGKEPIFTTKTYDEILADNGYTCEYYGKWHSPERKAVIYANRPITCAGMTKSNLLGDGQSTNYMNWWKGDLHISSAPYQSGALTGGGGGLNYMPDALDARIKDPSLKSTVDYQNFGNLLIDQQHTESALYTKNILDAIDRNKMNKFSIHCSFNPPHPPFVVAKPYYGSLNSSTMPIPANYFVNVASSPYYRVDELNSPYYSNSILKMTDFQNPSTIGIFIARYYEMVKEIDDKLGEILKKLDDLGLTDKTMIVFCGDHGEMLGSHGMDSKNNFYDESARVPLLIRYPAKIDAGKRVAVPVNLIDVRPTIEDYFNLPAYKCDGNSLRPYIENTYNKADNQFAVSEWYNDKIPGFMVRTANFKLMIAHTAESKNTAIDGFYDLKADSLEQVNILKKTTITTTELENAQVLKVLLVKWLKKVNSPYYYSVKARPIGRLNANYCLYQNDIAKIKIPGITGITGLPAGTSYKILTNDTIQITTSNTSTGLISATATILGSSSTVRFELRPSLDIQTSIPQYKLLKQSDLLVSVNMNILSIKIQNNSLKNLKAQIYSTDGKMMIQKNFDANVLNINTSSFAKGCYIVKIKADYFECTKKIIID